MSSTHWRILKLICILLHTITALDNKTDCVENVNGKIINYRRLDKNLPIFSRSTKFNIQLCGDNNVCGENITACEVTDSILPISTKESQKVLINGNKVVIHGSFKKKDKPKKFIMNINCNWETDISNVTYHEVSKQGKTYLFQMESNIGCVKNIPSCLFYDGKYKYDFTLLNKPEGWDVSGNVNLSINVCGPLQGPQINLKCNKSESQACDISKDLNMGSIFSPFEIEDNAIKLKIYDGNVCNWKTLKKYSTIINFYCSFKEKGPLFEKYSTSECTNYIIWHTPRACPKLNETCKLGTVVQESECTNKIGKKVYNLINLKGVKMVYNAKSNKDYFFNVCELLVDSTKCLETSYVLLADKNEPNIKYQTVSLGRKKTISEDQNGLLVKFTDGDLCDFDPMQTMVHIKCSDKNSLNLINDNNCTKEFLWNTPYVCDASENKTKCEITADIGETLSLDFFPLKNFEINNNNKTYQINYCEDNYTTCLKGNCNSSVLSRTYITSTSPNYILFHLNRNCTFSDDFNKIILNLYCDMKAYNDLYDFKYKKNCNVYVSLTSNYVCKFNEILKAKQYDNMKIEKKCNVSSNETGYILDINSLNGIEVLQLKKCPLININHTSKSLQLIYKTDIACILNKKPRHVNYTIVVKCFNETETVFKSSQVCLDTSEVKSTEACKLFFPFENTKSHIPVAGIIGGILAVIIFLGGAILGIILLKRREQTGSYLGLYIKDVDL
ncbi:unnamed protein product [Brassicogethes aeneus]|uniref:MRH domain-containing protein n=1 Tax=Brassicogethes aeneus TaxID=1431903 RepID=A0A9P0FHF3_BRAAE|nr:unnamed protein product [Brassicogethes aeneus]